MPSATAGFVCRLAALVGQSVQTAAARGQASASLELGLALARAAPPEYSAYALLRLLPQVHPETRNCYFDFVRSLSLPADNELRQAIGEVRQAIRSRVTEVPEAGYWFAVLKRPQALDLETLQAASGAPSAFT
jgi:hypothetical protein